jgi:hypothetical protein
MEKKRTVCVGFIRLIFVALIGFPMGAAYAQSPWAGKPSPGLAAKL